MRILAIALLPLALTLSAVATLAGDTCDEGCTPGYWKNHSERWDGVGSDDFTSSVHADDPFNASFGVTPAQSGLADDVTLIEALRIGGGHVVALNRHAAAALASSDAGICYRYSTQEVADIYRDAVGADPGSLDVSSAKDLLESANEAGCPLGNGERPNTFCLGTEGDCPCGNIDPAAGCANSTSSGGQLEGAAVASVLDDDLVLAFSSLPRNVTLIPLMAGGTSAVPFGDGRLCLGAVGLKIFRFAPLNSGPGGTAFQTEPAAYSRIHFYVGDDPLGQILPGSTWYFQGWYRDPKGPCGTGYNITNGIAVDFVD